MPFLLAEILNFQGSTHLIGVGSLSYLPLIRNYSALGLMPGSDTCIPHYTYGQLCDFLKGSLDALLKKYTHIYNISDDEALIMDCEQVEGTVNLVAIKRVKGEC